MSSVQPVIGGRQGPLDGPRAAVTSHDPPVDGLHHDGHRSIVHELHIHHGTEAALGDLQPAGSQRTGERRHERRSPVRWRRSRERGAPPPSHVGHERELAHHEDATTDVGHGSIHPVGVVTEDAETRQLVGERIHIPFRVRDAGPGENEQARPDRPDELTVDDHRSFTNSLDNGAHMGRVPARTTADSREHLTDLEHARPTLETRSEGSSARQKERGMHRRLSVILAAALAASLVTGTALAEEAPEAGSDGTTLEGRGVLVAKGVGTVDLDGKGKVKLRIAGDVTIVDRAGDAVIHVRAWNREAKALDAKRTVAATTTYEFTGFRGVIWIRGSDFSLDAEGNVKKLRARGAGTATLTGHGWWKTRHDRGFWGHGIRFDGNSTVVL